MNLIIIAGRVGSAPESKVTRNGSTVCNVGVATNYVWYDKDKNKQEETDWHRATLFGKSAETFVKFVNKGDGVVITGRMTYRSWDDQDGNKRTSAEIMVDKWEFGQSSVNRGNNQRNDQRNDRPPAPPPPAPASFSDDDIPFDFPRNALDMGV